ncbi:MAG: Xaa-Pro peptidase family protein [Planctomycetota bacterium]|nr:Xaa-Pro peptidase family protein [Planctomycetota bacterium]
MLTLAGCVERRNRLWDRLPASVEWVLVADPRHVYYLSGFLVQPLSFSVNERGLLLLERNGPATLLADNFTRRSALAAPFVDVEELEPWYDHKHSVINRDHALLAALARVAPRLRSRPGVIEGEWLPVLAGELVPTGSSRFTAGSGAVGTLGDLLKTLRRNKHADEIATLELAMRACAAGHAAALATVRPGVTEFDVYRAIHAGVLAQAGKPVQVYGDFRSTNAATPTRGGAPTDYVLQAGDLYLLDYSVIVDGYRSDFTNTVCAGEPSVDQRRLFDLCVEALAAGQSSLRAGVPAVSVYRATAAPLRASPFGETFTHHAGHGLGMAHPEPPILVADSTDVLEAGDVVTLEPGLYVPGIGGIRLEHNYLITETGSRRLSPHRLALENSQQADSFDIPLEPSTS